MVSNKKNCPFWELYCSAENRYSKYVLWRECAGELERNGLDGHPWPLPTGNKHANNEREGGRPKRETCACDYDGHGQVAGRVNLSTHRVTQARLSDGRLARITTRRYISHTTKKAGQFVTFSWNSNCLSLSKVPNNLLWTMLKEFVLALVNLRSLVFFFSPIRFG